MNWPAIDLMLLAPAMLAGIIVLSTHVPLGRQVLKRGIIFIDLAVAQIAGLGVITIHALTEQPHHWWIQLSAFGAALVGAFALRWAERHWAEVQEAIIGTVFVLSVSAALLFLSNDPHGGERLKELLVGQILWADYGDLWLPLILSCLVLMAWYGLKAWEKPATFYALFAIAVTASVQLIGVYLVFASLIIPALGTRRLANKRGLLCGYFVGTTGYAAGLLISALYDWPAGPVIVWSLALTALVFSLLTHPVTHRK